jgi:CRISPR-associated protein Cmr6
MAARWCACVAAAGATPFTLQTDWRLVSGVGRNTPYEVGFRFDRYGFATLPGSSVKGIARAYAWSMGCENTPDFSEIFGYAPAAGDRRQAQTGRAIFFDAMPLDDPELQLDVMTPHYKDYYQSKGEVAPTNWQSPTPIYFLTVKAGVNFGFAVGWRGQEDERLHKLAQDWLTGGLTELGAGAKTNAGYGYFSSPQARSTPMGAETNAKADAAPTVLDVPVVTRRGTIVEIRPDRYFGRVRDDENGKEYRFGTSVLAPKNETPGRKTKVDFDLQGEKVVRVTKA